ncbi:unnamed protein product [Amoebophrya sp. A25]|nr:unnamed protein product [Amoebophrya sp. A25]|eukprot:GSA25T00003775001.1
MITTEEKGTHEDDASIPNTFWHKEIARKTYSQVDEMFNRIAND